MSSARPDTWMPFYVGDYLRDTGRLTTEQHGAYLLLILDYWVNGPLPDDDEQLASVVRQPLQAWKRLRSRLAPYFHIAEGSWHHKRIDIEREKSARLTEQKTNAGGASGQARKQRKLNECSTDGQAGLEAASRQNGVPSQPQSPNSDPKGSAPVCAEPDPVRELFDSGERILTNLGVKPRSARALVGQCRKEFGDDGEVLGLLLKIERERIRAPESYIQAAIKRHKDERSGAGMGRPWA